MSGAIAFIEGLVGLGAAGGISAGQSVRMVGNVQTDSKLSW